MTLDGEFKDAEIKAEVGLLTHNIIIMEWTTTISKATGSS